MDAADYVIPDARDGITYYKDTNKGYSRPKCPVEYPEVYGIRERDAWYKSISHAGFAGSSGHDAPIIALDAILGTRSWDDLCEWAMLIGGDSPATGSIAGAWYGAMNGYQGVPRNHYQSAEYFQRMLTDASTLLKVAARS